MSAPSDHPQPASADAPPQPGNCQRLLLDVELGVEPLSGVLHAGGVQLPFAGWLGLASVLGQAVDAACLALVRSGAKAP